MYIPEAFREERLEALHEFMRRHSFGTLITHVNGAPFATHLPLLLDTSAGERGTLLGHLARANPHWRAFEGSAGVDGAAGEGPESLVVFAGPHAYVSPTWYETPVAVPTWNYTAVHAYGRPRVVHDPERVKGVLRRTVETYEAAFERPWTMERLPAEYVDKMAGAIVAFELPISRLEGKLKLSQNRSEADRRGVVVGLRDVGDAESVAVAELMEAMGARR